MSPTNVLLVLLLLLAAGFAGSWFNRASAGGGRPAPPGAVNTAIGFGTNFFDTLGIGSFATTTTIYRLFRRVEDQHIPGTLNVGHAIPTVAQAWIYTTLIQVDFLTLALLIVAAVGGSWIGAAIVSRSTSRSTASPRSMWPELRSCSAARRRSSSWLAGSLRPAASR